MHASLVPSIVRAWCPVSLLHTNMLPCFAAEAAIQRTSTHNKKDIEEENMWEETGKRQRTDREETGILEQDRRQRRSYTCQRTINMHTKYGHNLGEYPSHTHMQYTLWYDKTIGRNSVTEGVVTILGLQRKTHVWTDKLMKRAVCCTSGQLENMEHKHIHSAWKYAVHLPEYICMCVCYA